MSSNLDELAGDLAYARVAAEQLAHSQPGGDQYRMSVARLFAAFQALDNGGAFREFDEHTGYEEARDTLARIREQNSPRKDPAEWGDLSGYAAVGDDATYYGDHLDARGSVFNGPVTGKVVQHENP